MAFLRHHSRSGRRNKAVRVGSALPDFLGRLDTTGGMSLVRLWREWDRLMGEMAPLARPLGHRGSRLILAAEDPMIMQEAQYLAPLLLGKINAFLGEEVFDKVTFELLNGRVPLDGDFSKQEPPRPRQLKKPENLGGLDTALAPDSAIGRCYRAYQRMFADK
ncbi:DUF721 domain-containing protein [Pseudodesulfovibrio pelocollis]|uniref:DUF721 domain-containing protein n=1 Tax=Pseudodesulfovibrio pelocollis TaxID=3051432 RepID=UPI00255AC8EC|nr:DUF721 domain-containing protein [Pseudodesulfovibrio sp. SB368]